MDTGSGREDGSADMSTHSGAHTRPDRLTAEATADEALSAMYAAHWRGLTRLAWLLVRDQGLAEDVVQDAFVTTYRRWSALRSQDAALAYLRTSVVNGARSALRKRVVRERYAERQAAVDADPVTPGPDSAAYGPDEHDQVLAALRALPLRQREVLVLRYYADFAEADIAQALGISRGAVKTHASRGLAALRAATPHATHDATPDADRPAAGNEEQP